jgi:SAM-dependent methyltransferase
MVRHAEGHGGVNDALRSIPSLLLRSGYVDAVTAFGALNLRRRDLLARIDHLAPATRAMVELWWLERSVSRASLGFADEIDALVTAGLLQRTGDLVTLGCIAMPMFGQVVLMPSPTNVGTIPYGLESFALALRAGPPRRGRCLDLCSGSGIQALRAAAAGSEVIAIEIDSRANEWAKRNAVINSLDDRIDVRTGDLWDVAGEGTFDYVVSNPPIAFIPSSMDIPIPGGGIDGFAVTRKILEHLPRRLSSGGIAQFASGCLGTEDTLQVTDEVRELYANERMRVAIAVTSRSRLAPGEALFDQLVPMYEASTVPPRKDVAQLLGDHLRSLSKTHFYRYTLVASHSDRELEIALTRFDRAGGTGFFL